VQDRRLALRSVATVARSMEDVSADGDPASVAYDGLSAHCAGNIVRRAFATDPVTIRLSPVRAGFYVHSSPYSLHAVEGRLFTLSISCLVSCESPDAKADQPS
jgi:hypothetical protein